MKRKNIAVIAILLSAALLLGGCAVLDVIGARGRDSYTIVRVVALERQDIERAVGATGFVYSASVTEVHSALHFPVETVNVRVGDKVSAGEVLALLDMSSLEMDMARLQASMAMAGAAANQNLASAANNLETVRRNLQSGNDPTVLNARFGVSAAQMAVDTAEINVRTAELGIEAVHSNLMYARRDLTEFHRYHSRNDEDWGLAYETGLNSRRAAVRSFEIGLYAAQNDLKMAREALEQARVNLENANAAYNAARVAGADAVAAGENMVRSAQIATDFSDMNIAIEWMQDELEKAAIRAPVSGTVTAVNIEPGSFGAGLLFVIQDTDNLIVKTNIRDFDIACVGIGNHVIIRTDTMGSMDFLGILTRIAPTSTQAAYGAAQSGAAAKFECEVAVVVGQYGLRIGMNTRLSIIAEQRPDVYAVPRGAIAISEYGEEIIYIAAPAEGGGYIAEAVLVTVGMKTDQLVEVSAPALTDGTLVIRNAEKMRPGMPVAPRVYG